MSIRNSLRGLAIDLDNRWDTSRMALMERLGGPGPLRILSYRGVGRPDRLFLKGRVLVDRGPTRYELDDDLWDDLVNMYRRLNTTEIPEARVRISIADTVTEVVTDREGFFELELGAARQPFSTPCQPVELELLKPSADEPVVTRGAVTIRPPQARFLVISDIDDTVVRTQATNLLAMARSTFLGNARSRKAFPGVASLYQALVDGASGNDQNPLLFISRSPWNLYDLFDQFCDLQGIPGNRVICLRDWGISLEGLTRASTRGFKFGIIRSVLELMPDLPVILVGDSGQKDPEIYHAISEEFPGRLLGAFIRNVTHRQTRADSIHDLAAEVAADGASLYLADDSLDVARHAAEHGWIREQALSRVAAEVEADRRAPDALDALLETPPEKSPEE